MNEPQPVAPVKVSRRRKRSANGTRLGRDLMHIDKDTKEALRAMAAASGLSQIQLANLAIRALAESKAFQETVAEAEIAQAELQA